MANDDRPLEDVPKGLRRSRDFIIAAFLLLATAAWLPWWRVRQTTPGISEDVFGVRLFMPIDDVSTTWPYATGVVVAVVALWMFVRIAGRSIVYEPETWRKDTIRWLILTVTALLTISVWPAPEFGLFGGRTLDEFGVIVEQDWRPALGYYLAALAALLQFLAWRSVPVVRETDQAD